MKISKILLIHPDYSSILISVSAGLGYIAAILESCNIKVKLIDCQITRNYERQILDSLNDYPVVGISANIATINSALNIVTLIREHFPQTKIIMGGPHPTAIYSKLIPRYADIVVMGEGEDTIAELAQSENLSQVRGIAYWDGGIKVNPPRPLIDDLDRIPYPSWHLFNLGGYRIGNFPLPRVTILTSRGCPHQCIHCTKLVHGSKLRLRSIENIIGEIDYLVNRFGMKEIWVSDDNFTFYPERVKELCERIIQRRYKNLRFALTNGIRADLGDLEMFKLMARAGFYMVALGIESGSQEVVNKLGKGLNLKVVKGTVKNIRKMGMQVDLFIMIGLPYDTPKTMQETIDYTKNLPVDQVFFFMTTPFPGTPLYEMVEREGKFLRDLCLGGAPPYTAGVPVYEIGSLKAKDVERFFKKANREFYFRPIQIWRSLTKRGEFPYNIQSIFNILKFGYRMLVTGKRR